MKRKLRLFGCICILLLGCTKDFDGKILDTFDFSFTGNNDASGYVYGQLNTSFLVNPEKQVENSSFNFSYTIAQGDGYFEDTEGNRYEGEPIELDKLNFEYTYVPTEIGIHTVLAKATDHRENTKEVELVYKVDYAPFTAILKAGTNKFIVNKANALLLIMVSENTSETLKGKYKIRYSIDGGIGALKMGDEILEAGKEIEMVKGNTELGYLPTTLGTHTITMVCTSPDGFERTVTLEMAVENVTFFVTADPKSPAAPVGEDMEIEITLETTDLSDEIAYEIVYYFADESEGVGNISDADGETVESATEYPIEPGSYTYSFNSEVIGNKKIYFDVSDSNNQIKRDSVVFDYSTVPFRFSGSTSNTDISLNQNVPLNFTLSNDGAPEGLTYQYAFKIPKGSGVMRTPEGETVSPATSVQVIPGDFSLNYTPQTLGETELEFIVTDSFGQDSAPVTIRLNVGDTFGFSVVSDKSTYRPGENANLTFNVSGQGSYTATYASTNEGILTYNGTSYAPGASFPIGSGTGLASYQSFATGEHRISFTVLSDSGATRPGSVAFTFEEGADGNVLSFSADAAEPSADIDSAVPINFDLEGSGTFTATYSSTNLGSFVYDGNTVAPGQDFTITPGTSQGSYSGSTGGDHTLVFDVVSDSGDTISDSVLITFNDIVGETFEFDADAASTSAEIGDNVNIGLDIDGNGTYTATYTTGNTGVFVYNGANIVPGDSFEVPSGASQGIYNGSVSGVHNITIRITSESGGTASDSVSISYNAPVDNTITFSATEASGSSTVGSSVGINFVLTGNESYTATYTNSSSGSFLYNGVTVAPGQSFSIATGNSSGNYSGSVAGQHLIGFNIISNTGVTASDGAGIEFGDPVDTSIVFSANATSNSAETGESVGIQFDLEGEQAYTATYSSSSTGSFVYDGNTIAPGQSFPMAIGSSTGSYSGFVDGIHNISFSLVSDTNQTAAGGTSITFATPVDNSFTFSADASTGSAFVGEDVDISFALSGNGTYSATYTNSNTGTFSYNGADISPGESFAIGSGPSTGRYTGSAEGVHGLDFTIVSNTNVSASDGLDITYGISNVAVTGISVSPTTATVTEGQDITLSATVTPSDASDRSVTWSSGNTSIATVDSNGTVTGVSEGSVTITATTTDGDRSATSDVTVRAATVDVTGVSVSPTTATIDVGNNTTLSETVTPPNSSNGSVTWSSGNPSVATVSNSGVVTGVSSGTAMITATTADGGFMATSVITVNTPINTTITFSANAPTNTVDVGVAVQINLSLQGNESYTATYSTSNSGTLSYSGNTISPGQSFVIRTGGSTAVYTGDAGGDHVVTFSITSNTNVTASDSASIEYNSEPTSTIIINNWPLFETEQIGAGGTGRGPSYENANISTNFTYTPLSIRAEIIEQIPSDAPENEIIRFLDVRIGDRFGQDFLDRTITIPNGTNFTIYMQKPSDRVAGLEYQGASTTVRFFISNSVETITRDVTFTQVN